MDPKGTLWLFSISTSCTCIGFVLCIFMFLLKQWKRSSLKKLALVFSQLPGCAYRGKVAGGIRDSSRSTGKCDFPRCTGCGDVNEIQDVANLQHLGRRAGKVHISIQTHQNASFFTKSYCFVQKLPDSESQWLPQAYTTSRQPNKCSITPEWQKCVNEALWMPDMPDVSWRYRALYYKKCGSHDIIMKYIRFFKEKYNILWQR